MARDKLLQTVEAVHAAGLDSDRWHDALASVARLFGAVGATLEVFEKRTMTLREIRLAGLPDGAEIPYIEHYARNNTRANYAMAHLSEKVLYDYRLTDERAMDRDPYYIEYLRSLGLRYFSTAQMVDTPELHGIISIQRSRRQGHVERHDLDYMRRLLPHFTQAYDTSLRLRTAAAANRSLELALDWLSDGAALVRGDGSVLFVNASLRAIAREDDGVRIVKHRLDFAVAAAADRYATALAAVARMRAGDPAGSAADFAVPRGSGAPPYLVSIRPLPPATDKPVTAAGAEAIVFVRDPLQRHRPSIEVLQEAFGFTAAEANLASALQAGVSLPDYALQNALSLNTIYTHLRHIKEKTQTRRQAELVHKLSGLQLPGRSE